MAPNNLYKKFNQRTLEPSTKAWDRLDAMLSIAEKKPKKNTKFWYYIAASVVITCMLGFFIYNISNNKNNTLDNGNNTPEMVNKKKYKTNINNENINQKLAKDPKFLEIPKMIGPTPLAQIKNHNKPTVQEQVYPNLPSNYIPNHEAYDYKVEANTSNFEVNTYKYVTPEILLATVNNQKIDIKEIPNPNNVVNVNPENLLQETEKEINQSFRLRALQRLKDTKTAFVNRNFKNNNNN
jgi:hypothetical protein